MKKKKWIWMLEGGKRRRKAEEELVPRGRPGGEGGTTLWIKHLQKPTGTMPTNEVKEKEGGVVNWKRETKVTMVRKKALKLPRLVMKRVKARGKRNGQKGGCAAAGMIRGVRMRALPHKGRDGQSFRNKVRRWRRKAIRRWRRATKNARSLSWPKVPKEGTRGQGMGERKGHKVSQRPPTNTPCIPIQRKWEKPWSRRKQKSRRKRSGVRMASIETQCESMEGIRSTASSETLKKRRSCLTWSAGARGFFLGALCWAAPFLEGRTLGHTTPGRNYSQDRFERVVFSPMIGVSLKLQVRMAGEKCTTSRQGPRRQAEKASEWSEERVLWGLRGTRVGEAKVPGPYSEGGATGSGSNWEWSGHGRWTRKDEQVGHGMSEG